MTDVKRFDGVRYTIENRGSTCWIRTEGSETLVGEIYDADRAAHIVACVNGAEALRSDVRIFREMADTLAAENARLRELLTLSSS